MIVSRVIILHCLLLSLVACNSDRKEKNIEKVTSTAQVNKSEIEETNKIVAKVNNTVITKNQLDYAMIRFLPKDLGADVKEKLSGKVLNSLIDSRLMAAIEEAKLDKQERQLMNVKVEAYREELLVKRYIIENIEPQPITQENIHQYYLEHLEEFGEKTEKTYEIIQSGEVQKESERVSLLTKLSNISAVDDWSSWFENNKNLGLSYRKTTSPVGLLKEPLRGLIEATGVGETSPLLNGKVLTIVRVEKIKMIPAKPFEQVSGNIRRMMAPQALKISIKDHLIELKKNASIKKHLEADNGHVILKKDNSIAGARK